ncbi:MAG TPA: hypothetical protein VIM59_18295 [Cellvibrio sp.]
MNSYKKYYLMVVVYFLSADLFGDSGLPPQTPDGRFGTSCYSISSFGGEVCEAPFARLLATPERYDEKVIRVTGFMINVYGSPVLYVNKSSFESGADIEGIILESGKIPKKMQKKINSGIWPVYVVGRFNAKYDNDDKIYRLGRIEGIVSIDTWH